MSHYDPCPRCDGTDFHDIDCGPDSYEDDAFWISHVCKRCGLYHSGWTDTWLVDCSGWTDEDESKPYVASSGALCIVEVEDDRGAVSLESMLTNALRASFCRVIGWAQHVDGNNKATVTLRLLGSRDDIDSVRAEIEESCRLPSWVQTPPHRRVTKDEVVDAPESVRPSSAGVTPPPPPASTKTVFCRSTA